jgi:tetratricopeptide (TPR) repeat protein
VSEDFADVGRQLLELVSTDPSRALRETEHALRRSAANDHRVRAVLRRVEGIARRELGDLDGAHVALSAAVEHADAAGDRALGGAARSSLAFVKARLGELDAAIDIYHIAEQDVTGLERARLLNHLGVTLYWKGDLAEAAATLARACDELAEHDSVSEAKARINRGAVLAELARYDEADVELRGVIESSDSLGGGVIVASAFENLGFLAMLRGDLPAALEHLSEAEAGFASAGAEIHLARVWVDHARALANAALFDDANTLLEQARTRFEEHGQGVEVATSLLTLAEFRLAQGDFDGAVAAAEEASRWFRRQARPGWESIAAALRLQAAARRETVEGATPAALLDAADQLASQGWRREATRCRLVAARLFASSDRGSSDPVDPRLREEAKHGHPADRILLATIDAIAASSRGDRAAARRAVSGGLREAAAGQATLGSIEARAHAAVHGAALAEIGARLAISDRRPRELLSRIEATRLMSSRLPAVRPPADPALVQLLAELRSVSGTLADPATDEEQRHEAESTRARLELPVRRRTRAARGDGGGGLTVRRELSASLALLEGKQLLAHARLDGRLYAVSVTDGRARLHDLAPVDDVNERIEAVTFCLHRLNRTHGSEESRVAAAEMLYAFADELAEIVLPPIVAESFDPVVIVPTAILHDVPWGLLPPLAGRSVSVNASVSAWGHAERTLRQRRRTLHDGIDAGFVAGP